MLEVILDASQLEVIEACPRKWYYDQVLNITTRRTSPALSTGSYYHEVLKYYYSRSTLPRSNNIGPTLRYAAALATATELTPRLVELGVRSVKWPKVTENVEFHLKRIEAYLVRHSIEDDASEVLAVEKGFSYLLYEDDSRRYILEGVIDLISIEPETGLTVTDHKTQSRSDERYAYNHQCLNYLNYTKGNYFRYNYIGLQDAVGVNTFRRPVFKPAEGVLTQWVFDVLRTFNTAASMLTEGLMEAPLDIRKAAEPLFNRQRAACSTKYGICQFHKICETPDNHEMLTNVMTAYKTKEDRWRAWS